jgi:hypothetical protein
VCQGAGESPGLVEFLEHGGARLVQGQPVGLDQQPDRAGGWPAARHHCGVVGWCGLCLAAARAHPWNKVSRPGGRRRSWPSPPVLGSLAGRSSSRDRRGVGAFGAGGLAGTAGVSQADLAARGQGPVGLAGLLGEKAAAFGGGQRVDPPPLPVAVAHGCGGDHIAAAAPPVHMLETVRAGVAEAACVARSSACARSRRLRICRWAGRARRGRSARCSASTRAASTDSRPWPSWCCAARGPTTGRAGSPAV